MSNILLDLSLSMVKKDEMENMKAFIQTAHRLLHESLGAGKEFTGWLDLPNSYDEAELNRIKYYAEKIKKESQAFVVIGIGGSYLGARALIEALNHNFYNELSEEKRKGPAIYYAGNNISSNYIWDLIDLLEDKDISINVISKSGTTTEPAIAFRVFKEYMEKKYGKRGARERIYVTTDKDRGALRELAEMEGYASFVIPDDIGGRYSVLTAVGLLPIAVSGINIDELLLGASDGVDEYFNEDLDDNICYQYAAIRNILYNKGKDIEILISYEPNLQYFAEWWKQLFGESEGKDNKGIFPASANFTTDLHSLGQLIQDGKRNLFETTIHIEKPKKDITIKADDNNLDKLNYLENKTIDFVNKKAFEGTVAAHTSGRVPNIVIKLPQLNEYYFGKLIYFFEKACAISGYMLGVNPFDQPGVEEYKRNMFKLLGKPGY
ncbi:glucose-6-phosphate isomerase [Tepidimicrobium xylanilyticum]|uniref:Glucose-6-phosphate isomerase n=1 Tax=Tepidimicrobium xylanilyticum TaxID=1123352 RepID=A0A1H2XLS5_9FIRM|nr:glucose-6-phosphate isomerase [Tepidimicrobium xylanilyticum]GMG97540.1 glucose-6-phosphate isomerase [Tepidimicrobium xylanilyticum]SDW93851.1 glucose-6-phosphate isomerase [Tepidimicrobium xylanilyticum]